MLKYSTVLLIRRICMVKVLMKSCLVSQNYAIDNE